MKWYRNPTLKPGIISFTSVGKVKIKVKIMKIRLLLVMTQRFLRSQSDPTNKRLRKWNRM